MLKPNEHGALSLYDEDGEMLYEVFFKTPNNHDTMAESNRTGLECKDKSLTDQSFKDEANINTIMERVLATQQMPLALPEHFGDATAIPSLFEARCRIAENNATFYKLPARIREEFSNDPAQWEIQVMRDLATGNVEHLAEMGIDIDPDSITRKPPEGVQGATPAPGTPEGTVAPATVQNGPKGP